MCRKSISAMLIWFLILQFSFLSNVVRNARFYFSDSFFGDLRTQRFSSSIPRMYCKKIFTDKGIPLLNNKESNSESFITFCMKIVLIAFPKVVSAQFSIIFVWDFSLEFSGINLCSDLSCSKYRIIELDLQIAVFYQKW